MYAVCSEERQEHSGSATSPTTSAAVNPALDMLESELEAAVAAGYGDAFTVYLQGLVATDKGQKQAARQLLVTSLTDFPCNWGAWQVRSRERRRTSKMPSKLRSGEMF